MDELFSQTTFTRLVYVRPNIETLARTAFSYTTATNAMMPTALEPWTEFPASRFQSLKPGRYSPISNISNWIEVHEKINVQDFFMEINWATRSIYHAEISTDLLIKSTAIQADILIDGIIQYSIYLDLIDRLYFLLFQLTKISEHYV